MKLILTCPEETKDVLIQELLALGATAIEPGFRAVYCDATEDVFYQLHLQLRTASRILQVIKDVPARSPEMLYSQASRIPWETFFDVKRGFLIEGVPTERGAGLMGSNDISKKIREGIQARFKEKIGSTPKVDLKEPKVIVVAFLRAGRCMLSFDTTGKAMHKRGYRVEGHAAPLKETLAAALLKIAGYDGSQVLMDAMCGSGTIAIEAAMIALHKAPLIHRKKGEFLFEWLKSFNPAKWREIQDAARLEKQGSLQAPIYASDIHAESVEIAREAALKARVERYIEFRAMPFQELQPPANSGLLIANLPYGERISADDSNLEELYKEIGDTLKQRFSGWKAALLAAVDSPWPKIGLKPSRKIPVLNGSIECRLLIYDLYSGSRRHKDS